MKKVLLALGVSLASLAVFAAVKTTFYGPIDMQNNKVINVADPTANKDAANKQYVDTGLSAKLGKSGGDVMSGNLNMGGYKVTAMTAPTQEYDAANKGYVDGATNTVKYACNTNMYAEIHGRLNKQGGALTGTLDMLTNYIIRVKKPRNGANGKLDATPRDYVDGATNAIKTYVRLNYLPLIGGTLSGNIDMDGSYYVTGLPLPRTGDDGLTDAVSKRYVNNTFLPLTGGDLTGRLNMKNHKIINLAYPESDTDAATKSYVDVAVSQIDVDDYGYQYFALRKGSSYTPLFDMSHNFPTNFDVVVTKPFNGQLVASVQGVSADVSISSANPTRKEWRVGNTFQIGFTPRSDASVATNGTVVIKALSGNNLVAAGNFGVTFPPVTAPRYDLLFAMPSLDGVQRINSTTPLDIASIPGFDENTFSGQLRLGITNVNHAASVNMSITSGGWTTYEGSTLYTAYFHVGGAPSTTLPLSIPAGGCAWCDVTLYGYTNSEGAKWSPAIQNQGYPTAVYGPVFKEPYVPSLFEVVMDGVTLQPNTSYDLRDFGGPTSIAFTIRSVSDDAVHAYCSFNTAKTYSGSSDYFARIKVDNEDATRLPYNRNFGFTSDDPDRAITVFLSSDYDVLQGLSWSFSLTDGNNGKTYTFGPFFVPPEL